MSKKNVSKSKSGSRSVGEGQPIKPPVQRPGSGHTTSKTQKSK
jgi:hypothetical protein